MKEFAKRYNGYTGSLSRVIRLTVLILLLVFLLTQLHEVLGLKVSLFLLSAFFINEVFFHFYLGRKMPSVSIKDHPDSQDLYESMTFSAARTMVSGSIFAMLARLLQQDSVQECIGKLGVTPDQLPKADLSLDSVVMKARELVVQVKGDFITPVDLMTAYLLLIEPQTKLLLSKKIQQADVMNVLLWIRNTYPEVEHPKSVRVHFWGKGIGDDFVTGWTLETKKYTQDYTDFAVTHPPVIVDRDQELQQIKETLLKTENNNVLLIGESGVGKESLVHLLAYQSYMGMLDEKLNKRRVLEVLVNAFLAGAHGEGDLEARLQAIIEEVSHSGDIILYIPEFQNILGGSSYGVDISGVLLPFLRKGNIPIIASMSEGHYKTFMQQNPLKDVFEVVSLDAPEKDAAIQMVLAKARELEYSLPVVISYEAVVATVSYANRYRPDDVLPGSAVILLEDTAQAVSGKKKIVITEEMVLKKIETVTHSKVGNPDAAETSLLLHLEDNLHKRVIGQNEAISTLSEALRRLRANVTSQTRPVSFLFLGPTGVGKTETAKALADLYFQGQMIRLDMSEYADAEGMSRLLGSTIGDKRGELTEKIHDHPFSLVLLDEFEKAAPDILNLFLQVLDDGRLTDNRGQTVSFVNAIIIATSNAGSEFIRESLQQGAPQAGFQRQLLNLLQSKNIFRPELLNRFDAVIAFHPLEQQEIQQVVGLLLQSVTEKLKSQDITVAFTENVVKKVALEGFDKQFGARPLRRFIEASIEDLLAKEILAGRLPRGSKITVDCDATGKFLIIPAS